MAFFRKTKKTEDVLSGASSNAETQKHLSKWDALEMMISEGHDAPSTDTSSSDLDINLETDTFSGPSLDMNTYETDRASSMSPELKIDLPDDSEFIDVTPNPEPARTIGAMAPSKHFNRSASKETPAPSSAPLDKQDLSKSKDGFVPPPPATHRAMQRIENLTGFVERAEVDFSLLNRLEPENRRLKARNRTIEREIEASAQKMNVLRADLEDREQRLSEKTRVYENALGKLSVAKKSLQEYERALNKSRESADRAYHRNIRRYGREAKCLY